DYREFDEHLRNIDDFSWIVFSSRYGVEYFFRRLRGIGLDFRVLKGIKIAAIGKSTEKQLSEFGIKADLVPKLESSRGLLEEFKKIGIKGERIFMPRSDLADKGLQRGLKKLGAKVTSAVAYRNVMPKDLPDVDLNAFDEIYFTSPSTVRNFRKKYGRVPRGVKVRCIGKVTEKEYYGMRKGKL
ncbi:MAG: uroporphyrinogen-III synthase, partial [Candidatus Margulisiibacteriota bacterium]